MAKLDITSTAAEKAIEGATTFLGLISKPAATEFGLMLQDKMTERRFNQQLKMLGRAKAKCEKHGINPKHISFKLLAPLLEYSGLEEDDEMLDNWANLLANLVDSEQNIQNHVFPYILSQISIDEFEILRKTYINQIKTIEQTENLLRRFLLEKPDVIPELEKKKKSLVIKGTKTKEDDEILSINKQVQDLNSQIEAYQSLNDDSIKKTLLSLPKFPITVDNVRVFDMQINNLERLGLTKTISVHRIEVDKIPTGVAKIISSLHSKNYVEVETDESIVLTSLGELFIKSCLEKKLN